MIVRPAGNNYCATWTDHTGTRYHMIAASRARALLCLAEVAFTTHNAASNPQPVHKQTRSAP